MVLINLPNRGSGFAYPPDEQAVGERADNPTGEQPATHASEGAGLLHIPLQEESDPHTPHGGVKRGKQGLLHGLGQRERTGRTGKAVRAYGCEKEREHFLSLSHEEKLKFIEDAFKGGSHNELEHSKDLIDLIEEVDIEDRGGLHLKHMDSILQFHDADAQVEAYAHTLSRVKETHSEFTHFLPVWVFYVSMESNYVVCKIVDRLTEDVNNLANLPRENMMPYIKGIIKRISIVKKMPITQPQKQSIGVVIRTIIQLLTQATAPETEPLRLSLLQELRMGRNRLRVGLRMGRNRLRVGKKGAKANLGV